MACLCARRKAVAIIGARIRSESSEKKGDILSVRKKDGNIEEFRKNETQQLIISYSETIARKNE
ncbi:MAG: hypothetical protein Q4F50_05640 [Bacteroides sp.]|uniref:hypothetical protein n=1 Tax=Bacteroides sp. TaxID=29523 RepID=UPI0026E08569|nr:hypothetical protein [Bacteroides sp.]MDO5419528.1 hypothetical protein [Bacteroides sp.]